jgi:hypothetical protein
MSCNRPSAFAPQLLLYLLAICVIHPGLDGHEVVVVGAGLEHERAEAW